MLVRYREGRSEAKYNCSRSVDLLRVTLTLLVTCIHRRGNAVSLRAYTRPHAQTSLASVSPPLSSIVGAERGEGPGGKQRAPVVTE